MDQLLHQFTGYNIAAPGANTDIIASPANLTPQYNTSVFRLTIALTTASVLNMRVTDGTTAFVNGLNNSVALAAGDLYTFTFGVRRSSDDGVALAYNFQVETDSVIRVLFVDEVPSGVL